MNVPPGRRTVALFRLGYKATGDSVRFVAGENVTLDLQMSQSLVTLSEVVVTGTAGNQERRAQSAQVASLSVTQLVKEAPRAAIGRLLAVGRLVEELLHALGPV